MSLKFKEWLYEIKHPAIVNQDVKKWLDSADKLKQTVAKLKAVLKDKEKEPEKKTVKVEPKKEPEKRQKPFEKPEEKKQEKPEKKEPEKKEPEWPNIRRGKRPEIEPKIVQKPT